MSRLAVIGAGPIGIAAALYGLRRNWDVTVLESEEVGASLRRWGPTRFFTPLGMNLPPGARDAVAGLPPDEALLTGPEFVDEVLIPVARHLKVRSRHRVCAVGRAGLVRGDYAGHPLRAERGFSLLVETPEGERALEADIVVDASGVYANPAAMGRGGLPAIGERSLAPRLIRNLGELHARLPQLQGKRVLLIGHGHSAANALAHLERCQVTWAVRSMNRRPCVEVANDPLPERERVAARANELASSPPSWLRVERRAAMEAISQSASGEVEVTLTGGRVVTADAVVGLTGYRPDLTFLSELALEISPSTEGAARLSRALSRITDCLSAPCLAPEDLESGEPGFLLAGAKSYGRSRTFLLQSGYRQLETALSRL